VEQHEQLEDVSQTAARLNVPVSWVYANAHRLGAFKVGKYVRFKPSTTERWLEERRSACGPQEAA
jgi:hypothetical protein